MAHILDLNYDEISKLNRCPNLKLYILFQDLEALFPLMSFGVKDYEFQSYMDKFRNNKNKFLNRAYMYGELEPNTEEKENCGMYKENFIGDDEK